MHNLGKEVAILKISSQACSDVKSVLSSNDHWLIKVSRICSLSSYSKLTIDQIKMTPKSQFNTDGSIK